MFKKRLSVFASLSLTILLFVFFCACAVSTEQNKPVEMTSSQQKLADAIYSGRDLWKYYGSVPCKVLDLCNYDGNYYLAASYYESAGKPFSLDGGSDAGKIGTVAEVKYYAIEGNTVSRSLSEKESTLHTWARTIARIQLSGNESDEELRRAINLLASKK